MSSVGKSWMGWNVVSYKEIKYCVSYGVHITWFLKCEMISCSRDNGM